MSISSFIVTVRPADSKKITDSASWTYPNDVEWPPSCRSRDGNDTVIDLRATKGQLDEPPIEVLQHITLNRHQAEFLLPMLQEFVKTGNIR